MDEAHEAIRLGEALAALRREKGLSQAEAGARIGMTSQGWGLYESGKRAGLFRPDMQRRLTSALDATPEDLALMASVRQGDVVKLPNKNDFISPSGVEARGRAFEQPTPSARLRLRLDTDDMAPWAYSGVVLEYVLSQWPRRDQGCVLDMTDGRRLVRLYHRSDADSLCVRRADGHKTIIPRGDLVAVSAVVARLEDG